MPKDIRLVINNVDWNSILFDPVERAILKEQSIQHLEVKNSVVNLQTLQLLDSLQINNQLIHIVFFALKKHHHSTAYYNQITVIIQKRIDELSQVLPQELNLNDLFPANFKSWNHSNYGNKVVIPKLNTTLNLPGRYKTTNEVLEDGIKIPNSKLNSNNSYVRTNQLIYELKTFKKGLYKHNEIAIDWINLLIGLSYTTNRIRHRLLKWYYQNRISKANDNVIRMLYYYRQISLPQFKQFKN